MEQEEFPASLPRRMYWSDKVGGCNRCPECGGPLLSDYHSYVLETVHTETTDTHLLGNDGGHFCRTCPVVVLDSDAFENLALIAAAGVPMARYRVLGIIDMEAVPEDTRDIPFDEDTNPVPLVKFIRTGERPEPGVPRLSRPSSRERRRGRRER